SPTQSSSLWQGSHRLAGGETQVLVVVSQVSPLPQSSSSMHCTQISSSRHTWPRQPSPLPTLRQRTAQVRAGSWQRRPPMQSLSWRQPTHSPGEPPLVSQMGARKPQSSFERQPTAQMPFAQICPLPQSLLAVHASRQTQASSMTQTSPSGQRPSSPLQPSTHS